MIDEENAVRESLSEMLNFLGHKVRNGSMNYNDVESIKSLIAQGCKVDATVKDLAEYYG